MHHRYGVVAEDVKVVHSFGQWNGAGTNTGKFKAPMGAIASFNVHTSAQFQSYRHCEGCWHSGIYLGTHATCTTELCWFCAGCEPCSGAILFVLCIFCTFLCNFPFLGVSLFSYISLRKAYGCQKAYFLQLQPRQ